MIVIAEIFVFRSPFEKVELLEEKVRKLESSLDNFCASVLGVEDAVAGIQKKATVQIQIPNYTLTYTKNFTKNEWNFDPMLSFQIHITPGTFQKENLGRILSEISTICKGNFHDQYFVEVASEYPLSEYAK